MKRKRDKSIQVLLVDDHPIVRRGVSQILSSEDDLAVCGEASSAAEALQLLTQVQPTVVVTDLSMEGGHGLGLIKDILARYPDLPILVLSIHRDAIYVERAMQAGAKGYVTKQDAPDLIVAAVRKLAAGEIYVCEKIATQILTTMFARHGRTKESTLVSALSDRELEILEQIGGGVGTGKIAKKLNISINTVETHRARIKEKLQLADAGALSAFAVQWRSAQA